MLVSNFSSAAREAKKAERVKQYNTFLALVNKNGVDVAIEELLELGVPEDTVYELTYIHCMGAREM